MPHTVLWLQDFECCKQWLEHRSGSGEQGILLYGAKAKLNGVQSQLGAEAWALAFWYLALAQLLAESVPICDVQPTVTL